MKLRKHILMIGHIFFITSLIVVLRTALDAYFDTLQIIALRLFANFKTKSSAVENIDNITINGALLLDDVINSCYQNCIRSVF